MTATTSEIKEDATSDGFEQCFDQVLGHLQASAQGLDRARVLGVVGCRSGDGTTFVFAALGRLLAARSCKRILQADCADLFIASGFTPAELLSHCWFTEQPGRWRFSRPDGIGLPSDAPEGNLRSAMEVLESQFDFVLLDCGAITTSGRLWQLAPLIDDLFLVVAAGETRRDQVSFAQRIIAQSGAHLAGCILNKRTYPLPRPIHRLLS